MLLYIPENPIHDENDMGQRLFMYRSLSNTRCFHLGFFTCLTLCMGKVWQGFNLCIKCNVSLLTFIQPYIPSIRFCQSSLQNTSHSSSVSNHRLKQLSAALKHPVTPTLQVTCVSYPWCGWMLSWRLSPVRARD